MVIETHFIRFSEDEVEVLRGWMKMKLDGMDDGWK